MTHGHEPQAGRPPMPGHPHARGSQPPYPRQPYPQAPYPQQPYPQAPYPQQPHPQPQQPHPWDGFSVAGFVSALCGLGLTVLAVPALVLGAVGLARTGPGGRRGRGLAMTAVVLGGSVVVAVFAVVAAVAMTSIVDNLADRDDDLVAADEPADDGAGPDRDRPAPDPAPSGPEESEPSPDEGPGGQEPSVPDDGPPADALPDRRTLAEVQVGNCLAEFPQATPAGYPVADRSVAAVAGSEPETVWEVVVVPCSGPHVYEVFDEYEMSALSGDSWPGSDQADTIAYEGCLTRFDEATTARSVDPAGLGVDVLYPTEDGWDAGDRLVTCMIFNLAGGELVGGPLLSDRDPG